MGRPARRLLWPPSLPQCRPLRSFQPNDPFAACSFAWCPPSVPLLVASPRDALRRHGQPSWSSISTFVASIIYAVTSGRADGGRILAMRPLRPSPAVPTLRRSVPHPARTRTHPRTRASDLPRFRRLRERPPLGGLRRDAGRFPYP